MDWFFLVIAIGSNAGTAVTVMPEKYEQAQCMKIASDYKWPWQVTCVPAPKGQFK